VNDLGNKYVFWNLSPEQQKRIVARDCSWESPWVKEISRLAIENANNLGKDRDSELKDILDEDLL